MLRDEWLIAAASESAPTPTPMMLCESCATLDAIAPRRNPKGAVMAEGLPIDPLWPAGTPVAVLTTEPLGRPLDYRAPEGGVGPGALVE